MSKAVLGTSFAKIAECFRPAVVSSAVMAICIMRAKITIGTQAGLGGLLFDICFGVVIYFLALRIFYKKLLDDAIRLLLGRENVSSPVKQIV
jgi:hypothetical protein